MGGRNIHRGVCLEHLKKRDRLKNYAILQEILKEEDCQVAD
jgi:hypothetical protein